MSFFVVSLCVGLGGLLLMAVPGVRRHGRAGHARAAHGRAGARGAHVARSAPVRAGGHAHVHHVPRPQRSEPVSAVDGLLHYVPEPRVVLTVVALFGAFGNVFAHVTHVSFLVQVLLAAMAAVLLEWLVVGRIWRLALQFTGEPSSPLDTLIMQRVQAVTAFRNGKGIVSAERDGRTVQLPAELVPDEHDIHVKVGDALTIEDVDVERERVQVSTR